ncbi:MAG: nitronate monooxygenase family protein [Bordetella sp.]|nr:nitronate monooxygenase family protein [Bordetella sp.]
MALPPDIASQLVLPAIGAPMFLCSGVELAAETCKAGLIGSLTSNHCSDPAALDAQLAAVGERIAAHRAAAPLARIGPLAVNVSLHHGATQTAAYLDACHRHGVRIVITSVGDPRKMVERVHAWSGLVFHDCTSVRHAHKAIAAGVDGIIAIGAGGGGHSGAVSHLTLVPQIRSLFDGVIVMAGAVGTGAAIRAAQVLGADLAYLGTRLIATQESLAPQAYKDMLVEGEAADVVYTAAVNGVPANWLVASMRRNGLDPASLAVPARRGTDHLPAGVKPWKTLWSAGQGIGLIHDIPRVATLVERLRAEYRAACAIPATADAGGLAGQVQP